MHLAVSYAEHKQDSFYEGFDYTADDKMWFFDARFNYLLNDSHLLTFGADLRTEEMRSHSRAGSANPDYVSDSFDYDVKGLYLQDTWQVTDALEVAMALRYDSITADFTDPSKPARSWTSRYSRPEWISACVTMSCGPRVCLPVVAIGRRCHSSRLITAFWMAHWGSISTSTSWSVPTR